MIDKKNPQNCVISFFEVEKDKHNGDVYDSIPGNNYYESNKM